MKQEGSTKIICIGDLHGKDVWKQINVDNYDYVVFMGDYLDSYDHTDKELLDNLEEIVGLQLVHSSKVVLLVGNHDAQYLYPGAPKCSGFRSDMEDKVFKTTLQAKFWFVYNKAGYTFSHAGFSKSFLRTVKKEPEDVVHLNIGSVQEGTFNVSTMRGGRDLYGGPLWADMRETCTDYPMGLHQVVGHTKIKDITRFGNQDGSITYIDCLDSVTKFLELEI